MDGKVPMLLTQNFALNLNFALYVHNVRYNLLNL